MRVERIYTGERGTSPGIIWPSIAKHLVSDRLGLHPGTVTTLIHSGWRGLGYQVCHDYLQTMLKATAKHVFGPATAERTHLVYGVCHDIAKHERHDVQEKSRRLCVHRKGATTAFPPGHSVGRSPNCGRLAW